MPKSIMPTVKYLMFFLSLLTNNVSSFKFSRSNVTHEWSIESPLKNQNGSTLFNVVSVNNRLVYEWITCGTNPRIILRSIEIGFAACEIPITYENGCGYGVTSLALGNGKVLLWMKDYSSKKSCWRLYFVDPNTCEYDAYRAEEYGDEAVTNVLEYKDEFDVFFKKGPLCSGESVCGMRYNDKGINVKNFTIPHDGGDRFWLESMKINQTGGYFYASLSGDNRTTVKLFDPEFHELNNLNLTHTVHGYSVAHGSINLCYVNDDKNTVFCEFYDVSGWKGNVSAFYEDEISSIKVFNLADGGFVVIAVTENDGSSNVEARYFHGHKYVSQRVELFRQLRSDSLEVKHLSIRPGVDCVVTWGHDTEIVATKCFEQAGKHNQVNKCEIR